MSDALGPSDAPRLTSHSNSGDIIGHTTSVQSDSWKGWTRKNQSEMKRGLQTSGDIIGHTVPVQSDDFNHWPNKKKHLRMQDSGDVIGHTSNLRSQDFTEVNRRFKPPAMSGRNSGDIVNLRSETTSDDFMAMDTRLKKSPYKHISNVPLGPDNPQDEVAVPGYRATKQLGKKVGNFDTNLPLPEDLVRSYRPGKKMIVPPGQQSEPVITPEGTVVASGDLVRTGRRAFPQAQNSVLSPNTREADSEVQPVAYLGSRKCRAAPPPAQEYADERRPCRRLFGKNPYEHGNIVQHTEDRPHTAPSRFSKRVFDQSTNSESQRSADEDQHFSKRVFKDAHHSLGVAHHEAPAPAPVFAHTGYNQARVLKSALTPSRAERYKCHGDIVGWTNVKI